MERSGRYCCGKIVAIVIHWNVSDAVDGLEELDEMCFLVASFQCLPV